LSEIELSLISIPYHPKVLEETLQEFTGQTGVSVRLVAQSWDNAWTELVKFALYNHGPDVSEIGSTWSYDLASMNALRPFTSIEIDDLGGKAAFLPSTWQGQSLENEEEAWSVPWLADTRLVYYRRDILEKAGIDAETAFASPIQMKQTLAQLADAGTSIPWSMPTHNTRMTMHNCASWVWGAGGDFVSKDGKSTLFSQPEAIRGIQEYFELGQFLPEAYRELDDMQSDALYWKGNAAVTISGPWLLKERAASTEIIENTGYVFPPGVPFIGGSHLVIWKHSRYAGECLALVRFMTSQHIQRTHLNAMGLLPVRMDVLSEAAASGSPFHAVVSQGLQLGRSCPSIPLWGLVEDRLCGALDRIWKGLSQPNVVDAPGLVASILDPLANQLDHILSGE
jgi:multiple sugar transport system substrate-binding protein